MTTTAERMVTALEDTLSKGSGVVSVTVDGQTVRYETTRDMVAALEYWRSRVQREAGKRPRVATIHLGGVY